ncbi:fasciclin domain-containing protein [Noviherbaspirillum galbum]|uniref:Fasciclin domain-containing protein n=1 Tax=Noviherbaspirillum galbum TaxID=2709383 RepID=A0A6B3SM84_9BURK|nr:fasciclin domain-containing protein [Noviherbaspirillum galbum]NEX61817.1 fasciclin domain-containing protein [Noviherbaspirillum galbum]
MTSRLAATIGVLASLGTGLSTATNAGAADIVDTASATSTFKTFLAAAKTAGLTDTLKSGGPYTVFVPANSAFDKLPVDTREALMHDKAKLAQIIAYHVIPGKVLVSDVKPGKVKTMEGDPVVLKSDNGKITLNDEANITQSDIQADNGVIHEIDTVIMPK